MFIQRVQVLVAFDPATGKELACAAAIACLSIPRVEKN